MAAMNHRVESDFVHFVVESLQPLGPVLAKRMFGGHGIFLHDLMFALVVWDTLYFKVDDGNRRAYEDKGLEPFTYRGQQGRQMKMSYFEAPPEGMDDPEILSEWGKDAYAAALRANKTGKPAPRRRARAG